MNFKQSLFKLKTNRALSSVYLILIICLSAGIVNAQQYIHPNQAGSRGGNTTTPGIGNQVVVSTIRGVVSTYERRGVIFVTNKNGRNKYAISGFAGYPSDGTYPYYTTPQQMSDGNLYGTSWRGGSKNLGAIYKVNLSNSSTSCSKTIIHNNILGEAQTDQEEDDNEEVDENVDSKVGGIGNYANPNELSDGKIYIVYSYGGDYRYGQVVRMDKDGSNLKVLKNFAYNREKVKYSEAATQTSRNRYFLDGAYPYGYVVEGADGKVYGSTLRGGDFGAGTVWRMNKDGSDYEVIYVCEYRRGAGLTLPFGNVAQDKSGRIYFNGYRGGASNLGGLGSMKADGSDFKVHVSGNRDNGYLPYRGPMVVDDAVYGTFRVGGGGTSVGVVWRYDITSNKYTKLKTFENNRDYFKDGRDPWAGLAYDGEFLYGTCLTGGGPYTIGTLWKVRTNGKDFQVLHRFTKAAGAGCGGGLSALWTFYPSQERVTFANVNAACAKSCTEDEEDPLSINSLQFNLKSAGCSLGLDWIAENEVNVEKYEIEKSEDGVTYNSIAIVTAKGGHGRQSYSRTISHEEGQSYYRLKVIDRDGSYAYSEVRKSQNACSDDYINVFPNPTRVGKSISVKYRLQYEGDAIVQVYNSVGQLVQTVPMKVTKGIATEQNISLNAVAAGLYYVTVVTEDGSSLVKLQKLTVLNN